MSCYLQNLCRPGVPLRLTRPVIHRRNTSARKPRLPKRRLPCNKAENSEEGENVDIDELARQLSRAARRRRSLFQSPFTDRPSDFDADDFEIVQSLGYLSVKISERSDLILETEAPNKPTVVAFVARYFSGKPYQYPVLTLLKEFLPSSMRIAENEFRILSHLSQIPEDKWEAANSGDGNMAPVVQLLGYFRGVLGDEDLDMEVQSRHSIWFVYRWEGLKPLSAYFATEQNHPGVIWPWARSKKKELQARYTMLKEIFRGVMAALAYCHDRGVVHGSLGTGSVMLSTFDDYSADALSVKLDNFGFASFYSTSETLGLLETKVSPEDDIRAVGYLFFETVVLSLTGMKDPSTQAFVERLTAEIFEDDFNGLKEYCMNEPNWAKPVEFFSDREDAGWELLQELLEGKGASASALMERKFFE